jgi:putative transposase
MSLNHTEISRSGSGYALRRQRTRRHRVLARRRAPTARRATGFLGLKPLCQSVRACFGAFAAGVAGSLKLRHDHCSQFVADDCQRELAKLGIARAPALVRAPESNGLVERFIRPLKDNLLACRSDTIEDLGLTLHGFKYACHHNCIVERHHDRSPAIASAVQLAPLCAASWIR